MYNVSQHKEWRACVSVVYLVLLSVTGAVLDVNSFPFALQSAKFLKFLYLMVSMLPFSSVNCCAKDALLVSRHRYPPADQS